ncbi:hypothetical protein [Pseudomonas antarctica]|uniref:hypothetical protein n=1 Tax=Pseudomonas antarctica TaxID=219572 RepID=UPI00387B511D
MNDLSTALGRVKNALASNLGADGVIVLAKGDVAELLALIETRAPLDYGSLDAVQRLALCRGDMPVAVVPERLQQILKFLDGAENLDGHWFGEPHPSGRQYWWRNELRKALAETSIFAKQL